VDVSPSDGGTVSVNGQAIGTYPFVSTWPVNSEVILQAAPSAGYSFNNWTGTSTSADITLTLQMTCSKVYIATFVNQNSNTGSIAGSVWQDQDTDGIHDPGESALPNVMVNLMSITSNSATIISSTLSNSNGGYSFKDMTPALYQIRFVPAQNYNFAPKVNLNSADYSGLTNQFDLQAGQSLSFNAGIFLPSEHQFSAQLATGWNLFSLPYYTAPGSRQIEKATQPIKDQLRVVFSYQASAANSGTWSTYSPNIPPGGLNEFKDGAGYWLDLSQSTSLSLSGEPLGSGPAGLPAYQLYKGWNLVGFKSYIPIPTASYLGNVANKYSFIWGYKQGNWFSVANDGILEPFLAYWIKMSEDGIIFPYTQIADNINTASAKAMIDAHINSPDWVILDVRRPVDEYSAGHIASALNLDYSAPTFSDQLKALDKAKTYLVYCKAGSRSTATTNLMKQLGFMQTYNMIGGFDAWKAAGYPWTQ
jgi:phage shock protein E